MVSIRAEVNKITGGGVVTDREQRKVQRLKKKYDRKEKRFQKHRPSISDAYKVNL